MTPLAPFAAGSVQDDTQRARLHTPAELREMAVRDGQTPWPDDLADVPEYRDPQGDGPTPDPFGAGDPPASW